MVASASAAAPVIMGSAAPADLQENALSQLNLEPETQPAAERSVPESQRQSANAAVAAPSAQIGKLRGAVLQALADDNQRILISMLEAGEWSVQGSELVIHVAESQTVVEMSLGAEARRLAIASASGVLGRAVKLKVVPGTGVPAQENKRNGAAARSGSSGPGGRSRAEQDSVVRRMQEKFGAEIRTVIDYREKR